MPLCAASSPGPSLQAAEEEGHWGPAAPQHMEGGRVAQLYFIYFLCCPGRSQTPRLTSLLASASLVVVGQVSISLVGKERTD